MKQRKHFIIALLATAVVAAWGTIVFFNLNTSQELRQKAASLTGTETIVVSPSHNTTLVDQPVTVTFAANVTNKPIDGIQIVATLVGAVPANITFTPTTNAQLDVVRNTLVDTDTGKRLEYLTITQSPLIPLQKTGLMTLGTLTFTPQQAGSFTINFDKNLTKITSNQTAEDIVAIPEQAIYTFLSPTPTPKPLPDLAFSGSPVITQSTTSATMYTIKQKIINNGAISSRVYYQYMSQADGYSVLDKTNTCANSTVLQPKGTCLSIYTFTFPTAGTKVMKIRLDPNSQIVESNETNNNLQTTIIVK